MQRALRAREERAGTVRYYDRRTQTRSFLDDVLEGLARAQKSIPPKYFYDARGSELFEAICELPEYYPTRTELGIMRASIGEMARLLGEDCILIELGSGASVKTCILLEHVAPALYVPIDISHAALTGACEALNIRYPWLDIAAVCGDFTRPLELPDVAGHAGARRAAFFPGSTIGNFTREEALAFLGVTRRLVGPGGALLIGVDLKKDKAVLDAAYDDAQGITAAFNLNLLARINRELGGDFALERFRHRAFYDVALGRIEMHLESLVEQEAGVAGERFRFARGETIHTEISCKYTIEEFRGMGRAAGFRAERVWTDSEALFSVHAMIAN